MTSRERLLKVLAGEIPDCVPVAPDISNMVPARLTGKPFWDLYLFQDPPIWKAYIDAVKYFGFDSLMDGYVPIELQPMSEEKQTAIVFQSAERIVTQTYRQRLGNREWDPVVTVYFHADPPSYGVRPETIRLPNVPDDPQPLPPVRQWPQGEALLKLAKDAMGEHGLVGVFCGRSVLIGSEAEVYDYADHPEKYHQRSEQLLQHSVARFHQLMALEHKPDFICTGGSGTLIFQTPTMFRQLGLPIVKEMSRLGKEYGIPTHVHSCGPAAALVKILAEETDVTVVDPLEEPPMGDCHLSDLKRLYGSKLVLKGNVHTTKVMLHGTVQEVIDTAKKKIDEAAVGGRFILSTGDQCGRDTPDENLFALIETARTYGRY